MSNMLVSLLALVCVGLVACQHLQDNIDQWEDFKIKYHKSYESYVIEEMRRMIFMETVNRVREHNLRHDRREVTYRLAVNQFADLTPTEVPRGLAPTKDGDSECDGNFHQPDPYIQLPEAVDWREMGVVTPVKDQNPCGSCWAFSATGALEGQHALKYKKLVSLSEQNLMDCDYFENDGSPAGCNGGGSPSTALKYIAEYGIDSEESYPYTTVFKNYTCRFRPRFVAATDMGCRQVPPGDEEALKEAVATVGPISVSIDSTGFEQYTTGLYKTSECSSEGSGDHSVLIVGYGTTEEGEDYWLVKNSWGTNWGEDGYIKMARNNNNMCGIANAAVYPIV